MYVFSSSSPSFLASAMDLTDTDLPVMWCAGARGEEKVETIEADGGGSGANKRYRMMMATILMAVRAGTTATATVLAVSA